MSGPLSTGGPEPKIGWLLYDASCGFCDRWLSLWRAMLSRSGIETAALQEPWVASHLHLSDKDLLRDVLILLKDGRVVRGAEAYRLAMSHLWWARPLYHISRLPILDQIFDSCYLIFNRNRFKISHTCGFSPNRK